MSASGIERIRDKSENGVVSVGKQAELWVLYSLGMALFFAAMTGIAIPWEDRKLNDVNLWIKPFKFCVSVIIHSATLWLAIRMLSVELRGKLGVRRAMFIYAFCSIVEIEYIVLQAARGRQSHFNFETKLEGFLYQGMMGPMAVALVVTSWWIGRTLWKSRTSDSSGSYCGMGLGLVVGAIATLIVASVMSTGQVAGPGHWVGGIKSDAEGLPFFGWASRGGDLRVPHFFSNHTPQLVLFVGYLADRFGAAHPLRWISFAAAAASVVVAATFIQALMGYPLFQMAR